jgi:hypothetical protein
LDQRRDRVSEALRRVPRRHLELPPARRCAAANTLTGSCGADLSKLASSYPPKSRLQPRFCSCWDDCRVWDHGVRRVVTQHRGPSGGEGVHDLPNKRRRLLVSTTTVEPVHCPAPAKIDKQYTGAVPIRLVAASIILGGMVRRSPVASLTTNSPPAMGTDHDPGSGSPMGNTVGWAPNCRMSDSS